ncbi:hypothetical protein O181_061660 [Austropuccinia psidii MF-1]|uniref:Uncharacterized protein n=1 Tax=Austropuccinia psidii MF-1 TaxID=1389203 RepID=A0A9Q3EMU0_9BASI|nr:hypothetical protein [Austropuccinia psidii MF-1]
MNPDQEIKFKNSKDQNASPKNWRSSTSSQSLVSTFDTLLDSPEAEVTAISYVRSDHLSGSGSRDIPVPGQELVCGRKAAGVKTSFHILDSNDELLP